MTNPAEIHANLLQVQEQMELACARAGRNPGEVTLVAVSKLKSVAAVLAALEAGVIHLGENRVEEAAIKIPQVNAQTTKKPIWHMIGHIQSRKARDVLPVFQMIESVDRLKVAQKLSEAGQERPDPMPILLEVNISGEDAKYGFQADHWQTDDRVRTALWREIEQVLKLPHLDVRGLMTMAPYYAEMEATRPVFASLYQLREALTADFGIRLPDLSMGMTNDYPVAIEEGATIVRIGRAIFGERNELVGG